MRKLLPIFCFLLFLLPYGLLAQKSMNKGDKYFNRNLFEEAIPCYLKEIEKGTWKTKMEAREKLADCYRLTGQFFEAEEMYKYLMNKNKRKKKPEYFLNYAKSLKSSAKYEEAAEQFLLYMEEAPGDLMGPIYLESCYQAQEWLDQDVEYSVKNFGQVNSTASDFAPVISRHGLVFSSSREGSKKKFISLSDDISITRMDLYCQDLARIGGEYSLLTALGGINSHMHESAATFSKDGREVYFTRTVTGMKDKKTNSVLNSLQVFLSIQDPGGEWSEPESAFEFNSREYSVGQPSISPDGSRIFYVSDKPDCFGGTDIYYSDLCSDGTWGEMLNMGAEINTFGYELFPYVKSQDTLYFSSDTHPGMGKLDIFRSIWDGKRWSPPENLKPPFNSIGNDFGITMNMNGESGFFSSDRFNGMGSEDIYSFILIRPVHLRISGKTLLIPDTELFDGITHKIRINGEEETVSLVAEAGYYSYPLEIGKQYEISSRRDGFSFNRIKLQLQEKEDSAKAVVVVQPTKQPVEISRLLTDELMQIGVNPQGDSDTLITEEPLEMHLLKLLVGDESLEQEVTDSTGLAQFSTLLEPGKEYQIECEGLMVNPFLAGPSDDPICEAVSDSLSGEQQNPNQKLQDEQVSVASGDETFEDAPGSVTGATATGFTVDVAAAGLASGTAADGDSAAGFTDDELILVRGSLTNLPPEGFPEGVKVLLMESGFPEQEYTPAPDGTFAFEVEPGRNYSLLAVLGNNLGNEVPLLQDSSEQIAGLEVEYPVEMIHPDAVQQTDPVQQKEVLQSNIVSGTVTDRSTGLSLGGVNLVLLYEGTREQEMVTRDDGAFRFETQGDKDYSLLTFREGYFNSEIELSEGQAGEDIGMALPPIEVGQPMNLKAMAFTGEEQRLSEQSQLELYKLVYFMKVNPEVRIEVSSFTGIGGDIDDQAQLTRLRAEAVCEYIIQSGVEQDRVWARGYGNARMDKGKPVDCMEYQVIGNEGMQVGEDPGRNIVFSIQIGAYRKSGWSRMVNNYMRVAGSHHFNQFVDNRGLTLFQVGVFHTYFEAERVRQEILDKGIAEAFVVAYENHERLAVTRAREITGERSLKNTD